jgi:multidrug resistance efflux pump
LFTTHSHTEVVEKQAKAQVEESKAKIAQCEAKIQQLQRKIREKTHGAKSDQMKSKKIF